MGLRIRNAKWHFQFVLNGVPYSGSTGVAAWDATTERGRRAYQKALECEARQKALVAEGREDELRLKVMPLGRGFEQFSAWVDGQYREHPASARHIRSSFTSLLQFFGESRPVHSIRAGLIEDYKSWRAVCPTCRGERPAVVDCETCEATGEGVQPVTVRHNLHNLSLFLQYARKQGWLTGDPLKDVEIPSDKDARRFHLVTPATERLYFARCEALGEQDLCDLGRLMILQGPRPGEVLASSPVDVDLERGVWNIPRGKSAAAKRTLKLTDEARSIFARRLTRDPDGRWFFPSRRNRGAHLTPLNEVHDRVLREKPGLPEFVLYDLRHNFATRMAAAGMPLPHLQYLMGHASIAVTQRYVHIQAEHAAAAMEQYGQPAVTMEQQMTRPQ